MSKAKELREFAKLWFEKGMPNNACLQGLSEVYETDEAMSFIIYRKGRIQVEYYLMQSNKHMVGGHAHPNVTSLLYVLDGKRWASQGIVYDMEPHGGEKISKTLTDGVRPKAEQLLAFQYWDEGVEMTEVSARWVGATAGPKHEAIIESYYPNSVVDGYCDIRQSEKFKSEKRL